MIYLTIAPETGVVQPTIIAVKAANKPSEITILFSFCKSDFGNKNKVNTAAII